ncbi:uncharacterized protein LOC144177141 [Haemaphysalis longicornis]
MWPGGSPARSPVHPSPGFLLKCGKEHEKLQLRLRSQLQKHMLSVLEDGLFADVTIESGDHGSVLRAHKAVLVVRVPAFWKLLNESFATTGSGHFAVPLEEDRLGDFLRSIYSDDDIRMKEHDILRALRSHDAPSTDEDDDGGDFEGARGDTSGTALRPAVPDSAGTDGPPIGSLGLTEDSLENLRFVNDGAERGTATTGNGGEEPLDSLCDHGQRCDEGSASMSSSMVRSGTFDLQSQMPLEEAIDKWSAASPGKETPMAAFFLHDKSSAPVPVSYVPRQPPPSTSDSGLQSPSTSAKGALFPFYIDMSQADEGGREQPHSGRVGPMPRSLSLSMFIDINDEHGASVVSAQEAYSSYQGHPAADGPPGHHRMWEHFEREEILVVSEEASPRRLPLEPAADLCLLPMSPILRRKAQPAGKRGEAPVKASTRPQDVDALTFRRPCGGQDSDSLEHESDKEAHQPSSTGPPLGGDGSVRGSSPPPAEVATPEAAAGKVQEPPATAAKRPKMPVPSSPRGDREDDSETVYSEVSEVSGLSSVDRRMPDSEAPEACSKLGGDLLRMFIGQVETDVTICVEGKRIGAHRFILASRSDYFSLILREEFAAEEEFVSMDGFTHGAVLFALQHLYGGTATPPREVHLSELSLLAEVLGVDSLRQVVVAHVRAHCCHFFHKPCGQCIAGLSECLQMAACCSGLRELQARAVQWAGRHYVRVWPHRAFATVPDHWQQQCYEATLQALTADTAIEMALNCERLSVTLPRVRWAESALSLASRLLHDCTGLMSREFDRVLRSKGFLDLGKGQSWNVTALEDTLLTAAEGLSPDTACLSCIALDHLLPDSLQRGATQNFIELLRKIQRQCERFLIHNANRVVHCQSWSSLSPELQKKIRDAAVIVFEFEKPIAPPPRLSSLRRPRRRSAGGPTAEAGDAAKGSPTRGGPSSPKTSGSDSSERQGPATEEAAATQPRGPQPQGLPAEQEARDGSGASLAECRAALPGVMSASIESCRESSSDSGKEQIRPEKKTRSCRISRGAAPKVPRELGARPKSAATWAPGPAGLAGWAHPQPRAPAQSFQSLRPSQEDSHRCSGQVVRVPPFTIKPDAPGPSSSSNNNSRADDHSSPDACSPDFVAAIDAESNLVSHCLQEAELLERELSRKLRKQKRDPYSRPPPPLLHRRRPPPAASAGSPVARPPPATAASAARRRAASSESRPPPRVSGIAVSAKPASRR